MKLTILAIIAVLGGIIPLLWITGTLTSVVYFIRHRRALTYYPQLGPTMADGGDPMDEKKKAAEAAKPVCMTETPQSLPAQMIRESVSDKMFLIGGY